jgi:hypothetical protein
VLDTPSGNDRLFGIHPSDMADEQLDAAIAWIERRQPDGRGFEPVELEPGPLGTVVPS